MQTVFKDTGVWFSRKFRHSAILNEEILRISEPKALRNLTERSLIQWAGGPEWRKRKQELLEASDASAVASTVGHFQRVLRICHCGTLINVTISNVITTFSSSSCQTARLGISQTLNTSLDRHAKASLRKQPGTQESIE